MLSRLKSLLTVLTEKERRALYSALAICLLAAILLWVNYVYQNSTVVPAVGGEYIEGFIGQPTLINPVLLAANDADRDLSALMFAGLNQLAEKIEAKDGGATWLVALKKNSRWSDGEPLNAEDVLFTLNTIQDVSAHSPLLPTWQGVVAERLSEYDVRFTLKAPYAFFEDNLATLKIIPKHIFGGIPAANLRLSTHNLEPVGSGAYAFQSYTKRKDGFITDYYLKLNPNYAGGNAYIENFHVKFFASSREIVQAFNKLEIAGFGGLDYSELQNLRAGYAAYTLAIPRYYAVFMNAGVATALKDQSVREALALATDREGIIQSIFSDGSEATHGPIPKTVEGYDALVYAQEKFSIEDAQKILDKAGWQLATDGIREKMFGRAKLRLEFEIVVPQIKILSDAAEIIKNSWAKIGVKLTPIIMAPSDIAENAVKTRNYQMILFGNILKNNPDAFAFWHSSERFYPGLNLALYENKTVDKLLESIRKDPSADSRKKSLSKFQAIILADRPAVFLFSPRYTYVLGKSIRGFTPATITTPDNRFAGVAGWYLKTKRVFK